MRGPEIDFYRIRPYGQPASRADGFEELSSILLREGVIDWPVDTRFFRFGNPDGGREGKGVLPNGDVWAWQAKYLFEFDASAAGQVSESVGRVLENEPNLTRYFVTLPIDLPAGDTATRTSAQTRWENKSGEWEELARQRGMSVEFVLVTRHELISALTRPGNEGRARYWFDLDLLSEQWQRSRVDEAVVRAGRRYTPTLHVEVATMRAVQAVAREDGYLERWRVALAELRGARRWGWRSPDGLEAIFESALTRSDEALTAADRGLEAVIIAASTTSALPAIDTCVSEASAAVRAVDDLLHEHCLRDRSYFVDHAATLVTDCRAARSALRQAEELAAGALTRAADKKRLVITGRAGTGKTHLFCDVARRRLDEGRPTLLALGQSFDTTDLLPQLAQRVQIHGSAEDAIMALDAAAEATGHLGLLMIDALNESDRPERWRDELAVLLSIVDRYEHIAVTVSCRTEFTDAVLGNAQLPTVDHPGFAEATDRAVRRFTTEYGLEPPTFPVLNPEFGNPLFLKLTCEALTTLGAERFPLGSAGITTACNAFLEAVNRRLSDASRCDYDEASDPVAAVVGELAELGAGPYERNAVRRLVESALPGNQGWSRSLMRGLLAEGVLLEVSPDRIAFGYQRLSDIARAANLAAQGTDVVRTWFEELGEQRRRERGLLGALAVVVPEQHGVEFFELVVDSDGGVPHEVGEAFLESLLLRNAESITSRAVTVARRLLGSDQNGTDLWDRLLRIACIPGHPLNADWLHAYLMALELPVRDATWSRWLVGAIDEDEETAVTWLLHWAWPAELDQRRELPDEVASLATLSLGWMLSTTDRRVRDRATKALVSVAECGPAGFAQGLAAFSGVNDPYVTERLAAATCGATLRTHDSAKIADFADAVLALLGGEWPAHLLTRDYAQHVLNSARSHGWQGVVPASWPGEWPRPTRSRQEIDALGGPPDYEYGSIWRSLTGHGDFRRYVMEPALRDLVVEDEQALRDDVERAVFEQVLDLGWTPERFKHMDRSGYGGNDGVVERVGKKYQWIAFYEVLGRLTDHSLVQQRWLDKAPRAYEYAEQIVWRDIDPTVLVRRPSPDSTPAQLWFAPGTPQFPDIVVDKYPSNTAGIPDPLDLLAVTSPEGTDWLALVSNRDWKQPLTTEVIALDVPRLDSWMQLHAYLAPTSQIGAITAWAQEKDWFGRWMPDFAEPHNTLLGAHPDGSGWEAADGVAEWWGTDDHRPPCEFLQSALWYGGTGTNRDASEQEKTQGIVPTRPLMKALGIANGRDFRWTDSEGVAAYDPSVTLGGSATFLMRRDLAFRLEAEGLTLFWTVLAGYELHRPDDSRRHGEYRWITASASYLLNGNQVTKVHSLAKLCRPGPATELQLSWTTRDKAMLCQECASR